MADRNSYNENSLKNRDDSQNRSQNKSQNSSKDCGRDSSRNLPETAAGIKLTTAAETMTKKAEQTEEK